MKLNTTVEKCEDNRVKIKCEVAAENVSDELNNIYKTYAKKYKFPGFRPGKAPRPVVEAAVGKEAIYIDATQNILDSAYRQLINDEGLEPVDSPSFGDAQNDMFVEDKKPFTFECTVEVGQVAELSNYDNFSAFIPESKATDKEIDAQVKQYVSYFKTKDEEEPELTDELVKERFGFETVKDLRDEVAGMIEQQKGYQLESIKDYIVSRFIAERVGVEPTEKEVETVNMQLLNDMYRSLQQAGLTFDQYLAQRGLSAEDYYEDVKVQAKDEAKTRIGLDAWAKHYNIDAEDKDVDAEFTKYGMDPASGRKTFMNNGTLWELKQSIRRSKAIEDCVEKATWTEDTKEFDKQQNELAKEANAEKGKKESAKPEKKKAKTGASPKKKKADDKNDAE